MKRFYRILSIISAILMVSGCTENSDPEPCTGECCNPRCTADETCYQNTCIVLSEHPEICIPQCRGKKVCSNNKCVNIDEHPEICVPKCGEDQTCVQNRCVDASTVCTPACAGNQVCENGTCREKDPNACTGKLCKSDRIFCNDSGTWEECPVQTGCHLGYCVKGLGKECADNTCSEDLKRVCKDGVWIDCKEPAVCSDADSTADCTIPEDKCEAGSCSDNQQYRCSDDGHWEDCGSGYVCHNAQCEPAYNTKAAMLWTLCRTNSECSTGMCLKNIVTSRPMTNLSMGIAEPTDIIPVSILDNRIPEDYGICSADCTQNSDVCGQMNTNSVQYTCQLVITGDSPYPPLDEYQKPYALPFEHLLNKSNMEIAPFGAICRPDDKLKLAYSDKLCSACDTSEQCGDGENCIFNECLPKCMSAEQCPLGFECTEYKDTGEKFCMPPENTCGSCLDRDGDGQGFGHCTRKGFDCDDLNPNISYTGKLPAACTDVAEDSNCNGMLDQYEFLGTLDHCAACGDSCHPVDNANIIRLCQQVDPDKAIDKTTLNGLIDTFKYTCHEECAVEYADCDHDPSNGCETRLVEFSEDYTQVKSLMSGRLIASDVDRDTYGDPDTSKQLYCCPKNEAEAASCYRLPNQNDRPENGAKFNWVTTPEPDLNDAASDLKDIVVEITPESIDKLSDCNDNNATVYPGAKEICDGLNNDCNPESPDGKDDRYILNYTNGTRKEMGLGDSCTLYLNPPDNESSPQCGDGKVTCTPNGTAGFEMACISNTGNGRSELQICEDNWSGLSDSQKTEACASICDLKDDGCEDKCKEAFGESCLCNGIDDNCDGHIDEDWQFKKCLLEDKVGICQLGILTCGKVDGKPAQVCMPLYSSDSGRGYDFYGDGVDSNCDGEDFDISSTIFVTPYFGTGSFEPKKASSGEQQNVPGIGSYRAPYVSLKKALSVACTKSVDGVKCRDILVNSAKGNDTYWDWQTEDLMIPVYNSSDVYRPEFFSHERTLSDGKKTTVDTWTHDEIVEEYGRLWKEALNHTKSDYEDIIVSASTSKYLLEGEIYPRELVRIIGGMRMNEVEENGLKHPKWTKGVSQTEYNVSITYGGSDALYSYESSTKPLHVLIRPDSNMSQVDSMSLYLDSFRFNMSGELKPPATMKALTSALAYRGVTFIGLSCGDNGCRDLTFHNTEFEITAPKGISADMKHNENQENGWKSDGISSAIAADNDIWSAEVKKGYDGDYWTLDSSTVNGTEMNRFVQAYNHDMCLRPKHKEKDQNWYEDYTSWANYYDKSNAQFKGICPDGVLPFGGCGGGICTKDNCHDLGTGAAYAAGRSGAGALGGAGGSGAANKRDNCDSGTWCSSSYQGKNGGNGSPGKGGKVIDAFLTLKMTRIVPPTSTPSDHIYFDSNPAKGNGSYGQTGGGGGGGGICRGFTRTGLFYNSRFFYASGGGAGGCGGWQGHAGGTGGSAVGMFITPPARKNETLIITPDDPKDVNHFVFVTAGQGGEGQDGQMGAVGAAGGKQLGFYEAGHCEVSGASGAGGIGGSSGGGASGAPGAAYAFIFACNRSEYSEENNPFIVQDYTALPDSPNCGFMFSGSLGISETDSSYGKVTPVTFGADGTDAKPVNGSSPGQYGSKGSSAQPRPFIRYNNREYKPLGAVYQTVYLK